MATLAALEQLLDDDNSGGAGAPSSDDAAVATAALGDGEFFLGDHAGTRDLARADAESEVLVPSGDASLVAGAETSAPIRTPKRSFMRSSAFAAAGVRPPARAGRARTRTAGSRSPTCGRGRSGSW